MLQGGLFWQQIHQQQEQKVAVLTEQTQNSLDLSGLGAAYAVSIRASMMLLVTHSSLMTCSWSETC